MHWHNQASIKLHQCIKLHCTALHSGCPKSEHWLNKSPAILQSSCDPAMIDVANGNWSQTTCWASCSANWDKPKTHGVANIGWQGHSVLPTNMNTITWTQWSASGFARIIKTIQLRQTNARSSVWTSSWPTPVATQRLNSKQCWTNALKWCPRAMQGMQAKTDRNILNF